MSLYLLDTNTCIQYLHNRNPRVIARYRAKPVREIRLCSTVKAELYYGAYKSARQAANLTSLAAFFAPIVSLPFDDTVAEIQGRVRAELESKGTPIGPFDSLIAATALVHGAIVVSHNVGEFLRVTGLTVEDWEVP